MKVFTVPEPLFRTEPLFIVGCSNAQMVKYLKRKFGHVAEQDNSCAGTVLWFNRPPYRVVWVEKPRDRGVLVHELFHLVVRICEDRGVPINGSMASGEYNGDETAAYMIEMFFKECLKKL